MKKLYENQDNLIKESHLLKNRRLSYSPDERLKAIKSFDLVTQHINQKNYERQKMLEQLKSFNEYSNIHERNPNYHKIYNCNDFSNNQCSRCNYLYSKDGDEIIKMAEKISETGDAEKFSNYESSFHKFGSQSQRKLPFASNLFQYSIPNLNYNYKYETIKGNLSSRESEFLYQKDSNSHSNLHEVLEPSGEKIYNKAMKIMPKEDYITGMGYYQFSDNHYLTENYLRNNSYCSTLCNYSPSNLNYNYRNKNYINPNEYKGLSKVKEYYKPGFYSPRNSYQDHLYSHSKRSLNIGECICERPNSCLNDCYCYKNHSDHLNHQKLRDDEIVSEFRRKISMV